ncbi:MAG: hypothetical protein IIZ40_04850 [Bacilli bacterium]|nr:hypothetical protein [Bacilli bacterium]
MEDIIKNVDIEMSNEESKNIEEILKNNPELFKDYPILEIEYYDDGTKKEFYYLSKEKEIKETQVKSDMNEVEFNFSQNKISKKEYEDKMDFLKNKLLNQNLIYDNLIFEILKKEETEDLKEQVRKANLNDVDLKRLAASLSSIAENKINDFQKNNREFKENNITYWNYKYDIIAKSYAKTRELETFILSIIAGD